MLIYKTTDQFGANQEGCLDLLANSGKRATIWPLGHENADLLEGDEDFRISPSEDGFFDITVRRLEGGIIVRALAELNGVEPSGVSFSFRQ